MTEISQRYPLPSSPDAARRSTTDRTALLLQEAHSALWVAQKCQRCGDCTEQTPEPGELVILMRYRLQR